VSTEIYLPRLGSTTMEAATILAWLVDEGDEVDEGQPIAEVETDKTDVEVPAPASGVILRITAPVGTEVPVGATIGYIGAPGEELPGDDSPPVPVEEPGPDDAAASADAQVASSLGGTASEEMSRRAPTVKAAPAARRRARDLGVSLSTVVGTGAGGRISTEDVEAAANKMTAGASDRGASPTRRLIAQRMAKASTETAPVTLMRSIDASQLVSARHHPATGILDHIIAACAHVLADHPQIHARYEEGLVVPATSPSIGFAVQAPTGLVVPVIADVDPTDVEHLAVRRRELTDKALAGTLQPDDVAGGTFTVTNLGGHGIDGFTPIINLPQVAILGVGRVRETVVAVDGAPTVRPTMQLSLTFDHRAVDGAPAATFLADLATRLEPST
jgi:pyruvate dehydrogenase E2 component (dihydrolipoamide acetyltransferase)